MIVDIVQCGKYRFFPEIDEISSILNAGLLYLGLHIACFGCGEFMYVVSEENDRKYISKGYMCYTCGNIRVVTTYL